MGIVKLNILSSTLLDQNLFSKPTAQTNHP